MTKGKGKGKGKGSRKGRKGEKTNDKGGIPLALTNQVCSTFSLIYSVYETEKITILDST